jgi:hypothetical protein
MTAPQLSVAPDRHRARVLVAGGAVGLALALVLTFADAPAAVRTVLCLPLLVAISGAAFSAVLVPEQSRLDGVSRTGLVVLLGLAALLVSALLVGLLLRDGLPATRVVLVLAALTAGDVVVRHRRSRPARRGPGAGNCADPARLVHAHVLLHRAGGDRARAHTGRPERGGAAQLDPPQRRDAAGRHHDAGGHRRTGRRCLR